MFINEEYELQVILQGFESPWIYTTKHMTESKAIEELSQLEKEDNVMYSKIIKVTTTISSRKDIISTKNY